MDGKWEEEEGGRRVGREWEGKLSKVGAYAVSTCCSALARTACPQYRSQ